MEWLDFQDVRAREDMGRQILFSRESPSLQELLTKMRKQKRRTLVLWALEGAWVPAEILARRYPGEDRPQKALSLSREWSRGRVKMPAAKQAILQVHAMAHEIDVPADIARCHAVGQACSAVHAETHAIGLALYELTALVREYGPGRWEKRVEDRIAAYIVLLDDCARQIETCTDEWAPFLRPDGVPNREQLLHDTRHPDKAGL